MRNRAPLTLGFSLVLFAPLAWAQSGPAFVRDHVYGPGGGVVMTAEPDTIAPSAPPNLTGSADSNDDVTLTWSAASDIGSGVAGYDVYQGTTLLGSTTSTSYYTTYCPGVNKYVQYQVKAYDQANNLGPASSVNVYLTKCTPKPPPGVSLLSGPSVPAAAGPFGTGRLVPYLQWLALHGGFSSLAPARTASGGGVRSSAGGSR